MKPLHKWRTSVSVSYSVGFSLTGVSDMGQTGVRIAPNEKNILFFKKFFIPFRLGKLKNVHVFLLKIQRENTEK